jgi:alpha-galactosidase/6-phospho-beta-glucosidase family protein
MMARWISDQLEARAQVEEQLDRRAALEGKREHVYHAAMLDRHASSVLSLDQIAALVDELIEAHGDALPQGISERSRLSSTSTA